MKRPSSPFGVYAWISSQVSYATRSSEKQQEHLEVYWSTLNLNISVHHWNEPPPENRGNAKMIPQVDVGHLDLDIVHDALDQLLHKTLFLFVGDEEKTETMYVSNILYIYIFMKRKKRGKSWRLARASLNTNVVKKIHLPTHPLREIVWEKHRVTKKKKGFEKR